MMFWQYTCLFLAIGYALLILTFWLGWTLIKRFEPKPESRPMHQFSILIPARNEANSIIDSLKSIKNQNYPVDLYEVIVLNDHSSDQTEQLVQTFINEHSAMNLKLIHAEKEGFSGKKGAISAGIKQATFSTIILTDADCTREENWLKSIDAFMQAKPSKFIYAPVFFHANNLFERMQTLEFAGLVAIGGGAIQLKNPNMCSAANLIFSKEAFLEVGGYQNNAHIASGDDEFLLHKIFKKYPNQVHFLKSRSAIVYTSANGTLKQLTQQRRRWVSKSTKYENRYITAILVGAYFFNLSLFVNFLAGFWQSGFWMVAFLQIGIKMWAEGMIMYAVLSFFKRRSLLSLVPLVQPFHILYVIIIGIWANFKTYTWKERELN